jgi:hypothetical protein
VRDLLICLQLAAEGPTMIVVEQTLRAAVRLCCGLKPGPWTGSSKQDHRKVNPDITRRYIGYKPRLASVGKRRGAGAFRYIDRQPGDEITGLQPDSESMLKA